MSGTGVQPEPGILTAARKAADHVPGEPYVTVMMPIRNEADTLDRTLEAVLSQDYPAGRMEIIVADGMSNDGTREILRVIQQRDPRVRMVDNPGLIVPTGLNRAVREAKGEILVRVDGHTIIDRDYVRACVEALKESGADNVGGPMIAEGRGCFGRAVARATSSPFGVGGARFHYSTREEWADTVYMGAWWRATFDRIGVFDEGMVRNQDDEFNYRLLEHGGRILLTPRIRSRYTVRGTPGALWRQYFQYGYWKVRVMLKHPRQMRLRHFIPALLVATLLGSLLGSAFERRSLLAGAAAAALYVTANILVSARQGMREGLRDIPCLCLAYAILHLSYGLGFLKGLAVLARRGERR